MKKFTDLTPEEYEDLAEKAMADLDLGSRFIENNADDFDAWCTDYGIDHDYAMDNEHNYLESRDDEFYEFAFNEYGEKV